MKNLFKNSAILLGIVLASAIGLNVVTESTNSKAQADQSEIAMAAVMDMHVADFAKCNSGKDKAKDEKADKKADKAKDMKCGEGKCGDGKDAKKDKAKKGEKGEKEKEHKCGDGKCGKGKCGS